MQHFSVLKAGFLIRSVWLVALATAMLLALSAPAGAAYPGENGKLVFFSLDGSFHKVNPDGSGLAPLPNAGCNGVAAGPCPPVWSPDGKKIAFAGDTGYDHDGESPCCFDVFVINADGTGLINLTHNTVPGSGCDCGPDDNYPTWTPDGQKILVRRVPDPYNNFPDSGLFEINADVSGGETKLADGFYDQPALSPDGSKIAFARGGDIYVRTVDGSMESNLTSSPTSVDRFPNWSPDGRQIVFDSDRDGNSEIYTMKQDGTNQVNRTSNPASDSHPGWSPDGGKIVFDSDRPGGSSSATDIYAMNLDGTAQTLVVPDTGPPLVFPNWQPIPPHPHPVGASPLYTSLVPTYKACEITGANAHHGAPLAFPSCATPGLRSSTVAMGQNSLGFVRIVVCAQSQSGPFCNPAGGVMPKPDVRITGSVKDVRCRTTFPPGCVAGQDYNPNTATGPYTNTGGGHVGAQPPCFPSASSASACLAGEDVTATADLARPASTSGGVGQFAGHSIRITDLYNCSSTGAGPPCPATATSSWPATVSEFQAPVPVDCLPDATVPGSTCGVNTTMNALVPGTVIAGQAAVWQLGEIELKDSGPDGMRGNADDEVFATQGIFLP